MATNENNEQEKTKAFFIEIQYKTYDYMWDQGFSLGSITTYGPFKNMNDARKIMELIRKEKRDRYVFTKYKVTAKRTKKDLEFQKEHGRPVFRRGVDHFGWNKIHIYMGFLQKKRLHPNGGYWRFITTNVPANKEIEWYDMDHWLQPHSTGNTRNLNR